jgi:hypothetical protein
VRQGGVPRKELSQEWFSLTVACAKHQNRSVYKERIFADQDRLLQSFPTRPIRLQSGVIAVFGKINVLIDEALALSDSGDIILKAFVDPCRASTYQEEPGFLIVDCR